MQLMTALLAQQEKPAPQGGFGDPSIILLMVGIFILFYFILIRPAKQREKRDRESLLSNLKRNDEVLTAAGIIGTVSQIKDDEVVLRLDDSSNARMRVLKSSIARILNAKEPPKEGSLKSSQDA